MHGSTAGETTPRAARRRFHLVMIKPTHYDDDGYPIQWFRSALPSNTLASLNALAEDMRARHVPEEDLELCPHTFDETNSRLLPRQIINLIRQSGGKALIAMVGVQSHQFPRAVDLAAPFLAAKLPVCIAGSHVSGCLAMTGELPPDIREAQTRGIALFAGEAEADRFDCVLRDACEGTLKPLYNVANGLPNLRGEPPPIVSREPVMLAIGVLSRIDFTIRVDTLRHKIPNVIATAAQAGAHGIFVGGESINHDTLITGQTWQNEIADMRETLQAWRNHGAIICASYVIGFPGDTKEKVLREIEIIKRELPVDMLVFLFLTPLPGSEDHQRLTRAGVRMEEDMNRYDLFHRVTRDPTMSDDECEDAYRLAWESFYSEDHVRTIFRRVGAGDRERLGLTFLALLRFWRAGAFERLHPLEVGVLRLRYRRDRRPGLPHENPFVFYGRCAKDIVVKLWRSARIYFKWYAIMREIWFAPDRSAYTDVAITPPNQEPLDGRAGAAVENAATD